MCSHVGRVQASKRGVPPPAALASRQDIEPENLHLTLLPGHISACICCAARTL